MKRKLSLHKVVVGCGGLQCHINTAILDLAVLSGGPEGETRLSSLLLKVAESDHCLALKLPQHTPQVIDCALEGALSGYVGIPLLVALKGGREGEGGREREGGREGEGGRKREGEGGRKREGEGEEEGGRERGRGREREEKGGRGREKREKGESGTS